MLFVKVPYLFNLLYWKWFKHIGNIWEVYFSITFGAALSYNSCYRLEISGCEVGISDSQISIVVQSCSRNVFCTQMIFKYAKDFF